ncbi:MAG: RDD family protein [Chitinophagaceae bacterium]
MNTISITTTQNIDLEYDLAGVGERMVAWLADLGIFIAYFILLTSLIGISQAGSFIEKNPWIALLLIFPFVFYNLACDIWLDGQTIGKKAMKLKVISLNGEQATMGQYLIRWLFRMLDIYFFYGLPALIAVAASVKKQRIGDMVAGTAVIKTVQQSSIHQTIYTPTPDLNYTISFPEVNILSDKDMQLVRDVIINVNKTGNSMLAYRAAEKIKTFLQVQTNLEPLYFLHVLLADYNHITSGEKH